jgi:dienelactone hydrolase
MTAIQLEYTATGKAYAGLLVSNPPAAASEAGARRPGVLVLHGGAGPQEHERERARMLAALGYVAFVPDLCGEIFASRSEGIAVIQALVQQPAVLRDRLRAAVECLRQQPGVDANRTAAIGFCFGGLAALELARSGAPVSAVVSFHGGLRTVAPATPGAINSQILVCTGAADPFVTREHRASFEDEMTNAGADWQLLVHGRARHGFTERGIDAAKHPGCAYDEAADRLSWQAMRALFDRTLG